MQGRGRVSLNELIKRLLRRKTTRNSAPSIRALQETPAEPPASSFSADVDDVVEIRALHEQWEHVISHPCACGGMWLTEAENVSDHPDSIQRIIETVRCRKCGRTRDFKFSLALTGEPDIGLLAIARAGLREYSVPRANQKTKAAIVEWDGELSPSMKMLAAKLRSEHIPGKHYYRGQLSRQSPYEYKNTAVEALFPSDLRFLMRQRIVNGTEITAMRCKGRDTRDAFAEFLLGHPVAKKSQEYLNVLKAQNDAYLQEQINATSPVLLARLLATRGGFSALSAADQTAMKEATGKFMRIPGKSLLEPVFNERYGPWPNIIW